MIVVGVDLGKASDFTALAVARRREKSWEVPHLERLPLGTSYVDAVAHVAALVTRPEVEGAYLVVDQTGVGAAVCDLLRARLPQDNRNRLRPITLTSGTKPTNDGREGYNVPKRDVVGVLQVLLESKRLSIARELPLADTLVREMLSFQTKITTSAKETFGAWREGQHDDLVLALGIGLWLGENVRPREISMPITEYFAEKWATKNTAEKTRLQTILEENGIDLDAEW